MLKYYVYLWNNLDESASWVLDAISSVMEAGVVAHSQPTQKHLQVAQWWDLVQHGLRHLGLQLERLHKRGVVP